MPPGLLNLHEEVKLAVDMMFINVVLLLINLSWNIKFTTINILNKHEGTTLLIVF